MSNSITVRYYCIIEKRYINPKDTTSSSSQNSELKKSCFEKNKQQRNDPTIKIPQSSHISIQYLKLSRMLYTSTRDSTLSCSFEEAICSGYAPDGGLYVPKTLPNINSDILKEWSSLAFPQLAFQSLRMFISPDEIPNSELENICQASFVKGFDGSVGSTIPVRQVGSGSSYIVELSHGPTFCFKDLGMRATVNMLSFFAAKRQKCLTLVVSTTGDTGPACVQAVNDAANPFMTLLVHYPHGQISAFQRKQLTTVRSPYVHVVTFQGGGDDMDLPIKNLQATSGLKGNDKFTVCGVNSYNIGRPLVQLVHFVSQVL